MNTRNQKLKKSQKTHNEYNCICEGYIVGSDGENIDWCSCDRYNLHDKIKSYLAMIGHSVQKINFIEDDITFILDRNAHFALQAGAGCCSYSWFLPLIEESAFRNNATITAIEEVELSDVASIENRYNQGEDRAYALKIYTTLGVCTIEMRNDTGSTGMYGGSFEATYEIHT